MYNIKNDDFCDNSFYIRSSMAKKRFPQKEHSFVFWFHFNQPFVHLYINIYMKISIHYDWISTSSTYPWNFLSKAIYITIEQSTIWDFCRNNVPKTKILVFWCIKKGQKNYDKNTQNFLQVNDHYMSIV